MGQLIVIEGSCDGVGKSTQFNLLKEHLENDGERIITHHFPSYNTEQGKLVEEYLSGKYGLPNELSPYFVNSLYAIDRVVTWNKELEKRYLEGDTILLDRYTTSSLIYQAALIDDINKKKEFIDFVMDYEYNKLGIKEPDKVLFLEAPFDLVTKLRNERVENDGVVNDIHEVNIDFMKKVYENACFLSEYLNWDVIKCSDNNRLLSREDIHDVVYQKVKKK